MFSTYKGEIVRIRCDPGRPETAATLDTFLSLWSISGFLLLLAAGYGILRLRLMSLNAK